MPRRRSTSADIALAVKKTTGIADVSGSTSERLKRRRAVQARHHHVEQDDVGAVFASHADPLGAAARLRDLHPSDSGKRQGGDPADVGFIVHEQNLHASSTTPAVWPTISRTTAQNSSSVERVFVRNRVGPSFSRSRCWNVRSCTV